MESNSSRESARMMGSRVLIILWAIIFSVVAQDLKIPKIGINLSPNLNKISGPEEFNKLHTEYPKGFMVNFAVPWSHQCSVLKPIYIAAAEKELEEAGAIPKIRDPVPFFQVDMTEAENSKLAQTFKISGFPTVLFLEKHDTVEEGDDNDGVHWEEYEGERNPGSILEFVDRMTGPVVSHGHEKFFTEIHRHDKQHPENSEESKQPKLLITLFSKNISPVYETVAKKNRKLAKWHWVGIDKDEHEVKGAGDIISQNDAAALQSDSEYGTLNYLKSWFVSIPKDYMTLQLRYRGEDPRNMTIPVTASASEILGKVEMNRFPLFGVIDRISYANYIGQSLLWFISDPDKSFEPQFDRVRPMMSHLAVQQKTNFLIVGCDARAFSQPLQQMFILNSGAATMIAQSMVGSSKHWKYHDSVEKLIERYEEEDKAINGPNNAVYHSDNSINSGENSSATSSMLQKSSFGGSSQVHSALPPTPSMLPIIEWLEQVKSEKIDRDVRSEPIPDYETDPGEPVVIVGLTIEKMIFQENKRDLLLNVYAPWCGHCKRFTPEYKKLAKKVHQDGLDKDKVLIAQLDGTANESTNPILRWSGFPTILFKKKGENKLTEYMGERDAEKIWRWIQAQSSYPLSPEFGQVNMDL